MATTLRNIIAESPMRTVDFWEARIDESKQEMMRNSISDQERHYHGECIKWQGAIIDDIRNDRGLTRIKEYWIWLSHQEY